MDLEAAKVRIDGVAVDVWDNDESFMVIVRVRHDREQEYNAERFLWNLGQALGFPRFELRQDMLGNFGRTRGLCLLFEKRPSKDEWQPDKMWLPNIPCGYSVKRCIGRVAHVSH